MTVFFDKVRGRWRYDFQLAGVRHARECLDAAGEPVTGRRAAVAVEAEAKRVAGMAPKLPRANDMTVAEVINKLAETWLGTPEWANKQRQAREILAYFKPETAMRDVDGAMIQDFVSAAVNQPVMIWTGGSKKKRTAPDAAKYWKPDPKGRKRSYSTVNRTLPLLRSMFVRAYNTRDPITRGRAIDEIPIIKDLPEPKRRARPVPDDVLSDVLGTLPAHVADAVLATLYFGFRRTEVFSLQIAHVDFQSGGIRLDHGEVKNDEDTFMPGGRDAMQFLARMVDQARERRTTYLFTWQRTYKDPKRQAAAPWTAIKSPKRAWGTAMKRVEKAFGKRWRWHDIRAAFITQIAITSGGVVAQKLARHADFDTTQGYIAVADDVARAAAERASERPALGGPRRGKT